MNLVITIITSLLGYGLGVFGFSNILLPVLWAWPKARRLQRQGRLVMPIPARRFLIAPLVWALLILGSLWLVSSLVDPFGYALGLVIGFVQIVKVALKPNEYMEADFSDTFGEYLR